MEAYAIDETNNCALWTWEKYDDEKNLMGYTVGRFMKPDTPVPEGMEFFDIEDTFVAIRSFYFIYIAQTQNPSLRAQSKVY